jgi:hypothetical protein
MYRDELSVQLSRLINKTEKAMNRVIRRINCGAVLYDIIANALVIVTDDEL